MNTKIIIYLLLLLTLSIVIVSSDILGPKSRTYKVESINYDELLDIYCVKVNGYNTIPCFTEDEINDITFESSILPLKLDDIDTYNELQNSCKENPSLCEDDISNKKQREQQLNDLLSNKDITIK